MRFLPEMQVKDWSLLSSFTVPPSAPVKSGIPMTCLARMQVNDWSLLVITYCTGISACCQKGPSLRSVVGAPALEPYFGGRAVKGCR